MKNFPTMLILYLAYTNLWSQSFSDEKKFNFSLDDFKTVHLHNHIGEVRITGTTSPEGKLILTRQLRSASNAALDDAKEIIYLDSMHHEGKIYFFIHSPDHRFQVNGEGQGYYQNHWNNWSGNKQDRFDVEAEFTITMEIPNHMNVHASTHEKDLLINNIRGKVYANNHHDHIILRSLTNDLIARAHHGDIEVQFIENPKKSIECYTHHGDIKVKLQPDLSADIKMKSHHGSFFTDFDYQLIATQVSKKEDAKIGTKYTIGDGTNVRIGTGGMQMDFRTHHGDVYVTQN